MEENEGLQTRGSFGGIMFDDEDDLNWNTFEFSTTTTTPPPPTALPLQEKMQGIWVETFKFIPDSTGLLECCLCPFFLECQDPL